MKKKNKVEEYCCSFSYCKRKFPTPLGLQWHEERDPLHNYRPQQIASINSSSTALIPLLSSNSGENHSISKRNVRQKNFKTYQMVDESIVSSMDENQKNSTDMNEFTKDDVEMISDDDNVTNYIEETNIDKNEDENESDNNDDESKIEVSESTNNPISDRLRNYNGDYFKYQHKLYSEIYGIDAIESGNLQEFKNCLSQFEIKRLLIFKIYLFAKTCNISRNHGDDLLQLIQDIVASSFPNVEIPKHIPKSWKSVTRAIDKQASYYTCHEIKIPFPEHWEMNKWNCNNAPTPEEVVIRIRDPMELIADQCVDPIIHFLWKDHININCYRKTNSKNEDVFCDIMSSEWARKTYDDIRKSDPKGLLVPISLYADGVSIGMNGKANLIPVMMTLGWYSKELFKQDYGKMVIGYIDKLADISEEVLITHLGNLNNVNGKLSRTKCEANIKWFKKNIFFTFWKNVLDKINSASITGILVKILGIKEPKVIYPRISFHAGDDPAQHEVVGIKCGSNVKHGCIHCMYNSRVGGQYNRNIHELRDLSEVRNIEECEEIFLKSLRGGKYSREESKQLRELEEKGYHPISNPFFNAPFGVDNHIYNTPTDLMHLFLCGIIKSILQWTLIILSEMRHHHVVKEKENYFPYHNNQGLFDRRLREFPFVPAVPHLYWNTFRGGLMNLPQNKSSKEKSNATGSFGGFRSSDYLPALIQTLFAIGEMGDILPNQVSFRFQRKGKPIVELGNVTKKIHNAILAVLDMHFACKCDEFTIRQTYELENIGTYMEAHLIVLWNLKQTILYEKPRGTLMRKPHASTHIGEFIRNFGPIIYADTDVFESSHKCFTTGVWRGTSKRLSTLVKEMTNASMIQSHAGHLKFYTTLLTTNGISECLSQFGPRDGSDGLTINAFTNISDIRFIATSTFYPDRKTNILEGVGPNSELFNDTIFGHKSLPSKKHLSQHLQSFFKHTWVNCTDDDTMIEFSVVSAASYEGSKDSGVGKGVIYAIANNAKKGPRYDYINVKTFYKDKKTGKEIQDYCEAQVLMIIQLHEYQYIENKKTEVHSNWFFIVQYMQRVTLMLYDKPNTIQHKSISQLIWETRQVDSVTKKLEEASISLNDNNNFYIDMITIDNLVGSSMVIPYFSFQQTKKTNKGYTSIEKIATPIIGQPKLSDKFWCVDRKFFDRSGWEELKDNNNNSSSSSSSSNINSRNAGIDISNIQKFLDSHIIPGVPSILDFPEFDYENFDKMIGDDDLINVNMLDDEIDEEEY